VELEMLQVEVHTDPWMGHNMPCPVCTRRKAVHYLNEGIFIPCWKCQEDGWSLSYKDPNRRGVRRRWFGRRN